MIRTDWSRQPVKWQPGEAGMVMPLFAILLTVLVGFVAFAVDWGRVHEERRMLQNAVDSAALAGARELLDPDSGPSCGNVAQAESVAAYYLWLNPVGSFAVDPPLIDPAETFDPCDTLVVTAQAHVPTLFARIFGVTETPVSATARGIVGSLGSPPWDYCLLPLAVLQGAPGGGGPGGLPFDFWPEEYQMKQNADDSWSGNRQGVDLYGKGKDFFQTLAGTCPESPQAVVGEYYSTNTGNWGNEFLKSMETRVSGEPGGTPWTNELCDYATSERCDDPTAEDATWYPRNGVSFKSQSPRFVYVPIMDYDDVTACAGASCEIQLKGVALFFVTFLGCESGDGTLTPYWDAAGGKCPPGEGIMKGNFLQTVETKGKWTQWNRFGTSVVRLWQ